MATTVPGPEREQLVRRRLATGMLAGAAAAVIASLAWAAIVYYSGRDASIAAFAVGLAVGWAVRRGSQAASGHRVLGIAAAVVTFAGMMLGWFILDLRIVADVNEVDVTTALRHIGDTQLGWFGFLDRPFASPLDWAFIAGALYVAYKVAVSSTQEGRARPLNQGQHSADAASMEVPRPAGESQSSDHVPQSPRRRLAAVKLPSRVQAPLKVVGLFALSCVILAAVAHSKAPDEGFISFLVITPFVLGVMFGIVAAVSAINRRRRRRSRGAESQKVRVPGPADDIAAPD